MRVDIKIKINVRGRVFDPAQGNDQCKYYGREFGSLDCGFRVGVMSWQMRRPAVELPPLFVGRKSNSADGPGEALVFATSVKEDVHADHDGLWDGRGDTAVKTRQIEDEQEGGFQRQQRVSQSESEVYICCRTRGLQRVPLKNSEGKVLCRVRGIRKQILVSDPAPGRT